MKCCGCLIGLLECAEGSSVSLSGERYALWIKLVFGLDHVD